MFERCSRVGAFLVPAAVVAVVGCALAACSSDATGTTAATDAGGTSEASAADTGATTSDAGESAADAAEDAGSDSGDSGWPDAALDHVPDGRYLLSTWTCGSKDLLAFLKANTKATGVEYTFSTSGTGTVEVVYSQACRRVNDDTITYPMSGQLTLTFGASTCSATCTGDEGCHDAAASGIVDTYDYVMMSTTIHATRTLTAQYLTQSTLESLAGCQAGDVETAIATNNQL